MADSDKPADKDAKVEEKGKDTKPAPEKKPEATKTAEQELAEAKKGGDLVSPVATGSDVEKAPVKERHQKWDVIADAVENDKLDALKPFASSEPFTQEGVKKEEVKKQILDLAPGGSSVLPKLIRCLVDMK